MIVYKPTRGRKGSVQQAVREAYGLIDALQDPKRFAEVLAAFPEALAGIAECPGSPPGEGFVYLDLRLDGASIVNGRPVGGQLRITAVEDAEDAPPA